MSAATDDRLLLIVQRIERLLEERGGINDDIRGCYAEAKAVGYDARMVRKLIARRAMRPEDRAEADQLLAVYEAAIGMGDGEPVPSIAEMRPDAAAMAANMLAAEIVALEEPAQAAQLVEHVLFLLDLRAEIAALRTQEGERKKQAKDEGFDAKQIGVTVRWFEKVARHGEEAMRLGEQTFHLYRGTVDSRPDQVGAVTADPRLAAAFAPKPVARPKKINRTLERLRAEASAARRALGDD